jgi:hypothetical protein
LLANELLGREAWLEKRVEELAQIFTIGAGGFATMDNHFYYSLATKISEVPVAADRTARQRLDLGTKTTLDLAQPPFNP